MKLGKKNPNVDTSFLPDRERERDMREQREKLKKEWIEEQDKVKSERLLFVIALNFVAPPPSLQCFRMKPDLVDGQSQ